MQTSLEKHLFDQIEAIRRVNNTGWMNVLRLAFRHAPEETKNIMRDIIVRDELVTKRMKEIIGD